MPREFPLALADVRRLATELNVTDRHDLQVEVGLPPMFRVAMARILGRT